MVFIAWYLVCALLAVSLTHLLNCGVLTQEGPYFSCSLSAALKEYKARLVASHGLISLKQSWICGLFIM